MRQHEWALRRSTASRVAAEEARGSDMADETDRKIDALTVVCRHLIETLEALEHSEGSKGLKGTNAARAMQPSLGLAKQVLAELYR